MKTSFKSWKLFLLYSKSEKPKMSFNAKRSLYKKAFCFHLLGAKLGKGEGNGPLGTPSPAGSDIWILNTCNNEIRIKLLWIINIPRYIILTKCFKILLFFQEIMLAVRSFDQNKASDFILISMFLKLQPQAWNWFLKPYLDSQ